MKMYDTLSGEKKELKLNETVRIYVCGLTVYDRPHLGHALSSVYFDVLRRFIQWKGATVDYIQNFTDVDDKIINAAKKLGIPYTDLTKRNIDAFFKGMDALNIQRADTYPRVTENIPEIISMIETLINQGSAYANNGSVYFRVKEYPDYGRLSKRNTEDLKNPEGWETEKDSPWDFALWKATKSLDEPHWSSPWGNGRPGWHIECSAMVHKYLGEKIDIHGGGVDLVFPHHENERAQSESATNSKPFSQFWVHNGLLQLPNGQKMSKSLNNGTYLDEVLTKFSSDAIRLWMLQSHYRSPLLLDLDTSIQRSTTAIKSLENTLQVKSGSGTNLDPQPFIERFTQAMEEDLSTPSAIGTMFELRHAINRASTQNSNVSQAKKALKEIASVLGITLDNTTDITVSDTTITIIENLVEKRTVARKERRFTEADKLRDELAKMGVVIKDNPDGTEWSFG